MRLRNLLLASAVLVGLAAPASAADLTPRVYSYMQETVVTPFRPDPWLVGISFGGTANGYGVAGARLGYFFTPNFGVEASYDGLFGKNGRLSSVAMGSAVLSLGLTESLRVYTLGGLGLMDTAKGTDAAWSVGAGAGLYISQNLELDGRYRYARAFNSRVEAHIMTVGVNYRF